MDKLVTEPAQAKDISLLVDIAREGDRQEIYASSGVSIGAALERALDVSDWSISAFRGADLVYMAGLAPVNRLMGVYSPWLLSTDIIHSERRAFQRSVLHNFEAMKINSKQLINYVDDRNNLSKRWLKSLGFTIGEPEPYGYLGLPFRQFTMDINHV